MPLDKRSGGKFYLRSLLCLYCVAIHEHARRLPLSRSRSTLDQLLPPGNYCPLIRVPSGPGCPIQGPEPQHHSAACRKLHVPWLPGTSHFAFAVKALPDGAGGCTNHTLNAPPGRAHRSAAVAVRRGHPTPPDNRSAQWHAASVAKHAHSSSHRASVAVVRFAHG
jgi:hypothetical protein